MPPLRAGTKKSPGANRQRRSANTLGHCPPNARQEPHKNTTTETHDNVFCHSCLNHVHLPPRKKYAVTELLQCAKIKDFTKSCNYMDIVSRPKEIAMCISCPPDCVRHLPHHAAITVPHCPLASNTMSTEPRVAQIGKVQTQPFHAAASSGWPGTPPVSSGARLTRISLNGNGIFRVTQLLYRTIANSHSAIMPIQTKIMRRKE